MGKLQDRQTITPLAIVLGWRKLAPNAFSGVLFNGHKKFYCSWIDFETVEYYPTTLEWDEHYLGYRAGEYVALYFKHQEHAEGPVI